MAVEAPNRFSLDAYKRGYEEWDIEMLLSLYADEVEQIQLDDATPPSAPGIYMGKERLERMFRQCKTSGVQATVENAVPGEERAAATVTCEFPSGRKVVANVILDLEDGKIVRELVTSARDAHEASSSEERNKRVARRVLEEFFTAGKLELAEELFSPDLVQHHPDEPYETRGPDGIRARITAWRTAFPDLSTSVEDLVADFERVAIRSIARGTNTGEFAGAPPTGKQFEVEWESVYRFEDGKVAEMRDQWNVLAVLSQLGLTE